MLTYEEIKNWWGEKENKNKVVIAFGFVLIFIVGFGTGRYERGIRRDSYKPNYTTQAAKKPAVLGAQTDAAGQAMAADTTTTTAKSASCIIKGNISAAGKKIYHIKGGAFYDRVKPEQCFKTQAEAIAAGFVKSSR